MIAIRALLLAGALAGLADGVSLLFENPRSFEGWGARASFLAASTVLVAIPGLVAGWVVGLPGCLGSRNRWGGLAQRPRLLLGIAAALGLFLWAGVRVHVRFHFGEPLLSSTGIRSSVLVALASGVAAWLLTRVTGSAMERAIRSRALLPIGGFALAILAWVAMPGPSRTEPPPPGPGAEPGARSVLLITLDTFRADRLSCAGYPHPTTPVLDRLARSGAHWQTARVPIPLTNPSHASLFTGLAPPEHGVRNNGIALPANIPALIPEMAARGWATGAFVSGIPLKAGLSGLARGFSHYDDAFSLLEKIHPMLTSLAIVRAANRLFPVDLIERRARDTARAAREWMREAPDPFIAWVHLFDAHSPYDPPRLLRDRLALPDGRPWPHPDYDAELREIDRQLAGVLRDFERLASGRGLVVVVGDHGEGLGDHGDLTHGKELHAEDLRVPLIWNDARSAASGRVLAATVSTLDVGAAILRSARPAGGDTMLPESSEAEVLAWTFAPEGRHDRMAIVHPDGRKLIRNLDTGEEQAFDLKEDPGEARPLDPIDPRWEELRLASPGDPAGHASDLDPETVRKLRSLGYLH
ncbi:MAG: sulfatase-like hydrolase/transferase [Gemmatimonadota bacterium]|nr:sulfatase-like hydrolase/transferase [Gemmatimonadota bacterium]MDP6803482.1 sulfatase-like hydrolase/transferase [Gemmatimonadota bacterium]MDP7031713.1 sulfatase-like hydrolase/transferase [Gemmatimonadota bacterium]